MPITANRNSFDDTYDSVQFFFTNLIRKPNLVHPHAHFANRDEIKYKCIVRINTLLSIKLRSNMQICLIDIQQQQNFNTNHFIKFPYPFSTIQDCISTCLNKYQNNISYISFLYILACSTYFLFLCIIKNGIVMHLIHFFPR